MKKLSYKRGCVVCNKEFTHEQPHTKTCSEECRKVHLSNYTGKRAKHFTNLSCSTIGAITENICAQDLLLKGFAVFNSMSPSCYCDLIAVRNNEVFHIEVRTGYTNVKGKLGFNLDRKEKSTKPTHYAVVERNTFNITYLNYETLEEVCIQ